MDDNHFDDPTRFWVIYLLIVGFVLFVGWKQPLRYRFLSKQQIWSIEHPGKPTPYPPGVTPAPTPKPPPPSPTPHWMWDPNRRNPLDRSGYNQNYSQPYYRRSTPVQYQYSR